MEANEILQAISSVGFPVVAYAGLFWYVIQQNKQHDEEIASLRDAMSETTVALQRLTDKLE